MAKIITITLNPALDTASLTDRILPDKKLRCESPKFEPGGGGVNVSRAIHKLGGESLAIYPAGGSTGDHYNELLEQEGISTQVLPIQDWMRQNLSLVTRSDSQQYRFVMPGAELTNEEQKQLLEIIKQSDAEYCVISGSFPKGIQDSFEYEMIEACQHKKMKVIFDSSADSLVKAVEHGGLYLIKPNGAELAAMAGMEVENPDDLENQARKLIDERKAEVVLVSLGPQGAMLVTRDFCEQIVPPRVRKNSTVGAGDSMVGATVLALAEGMSIREAARRGVAAGTAATMNYGTELCKKEDVDRLYQWILEHYPIIN